MPAISWSTGSAPAPGPEPEPEPEPTFAAVRTSPAISAFAMTGATASTVAHGFRSTSPVSGFTAAMPCRNTTPSMAHGTVDLLDICCSWVRTPYNCNWVTSPSTMASLSAHCRPLDDAHCMTLSINGAPANAPGAA